MGLLRIGVLALQGAFAKHLQMLHSLGVQAVEVRKPAELAACNALIIPGGESTSILKQIDFIHFAEPLQIFAKQKSIFGTCAGLILMSQEVVGDSMKPFQLMDIKVERNAYGSQAESFRTTIDLTLDAPKPHPFPAIFIRAPRIRATGPGVELLGKYQGEPVLVKEGHHLACTFHPELGLDQSVHAYFIKMVKEYDDQAT